MDGEHLGIGAKLLAMSAVADGDGEDDDDGSGGVIGFGDGVETEAWLEGVEGGLEGG